MHFNYALFAFAQNACKGPHKDVQKSGPSPVLGVEGS